MRAYFCVTRGWPAARKIHMRHIISILMQNEAGALVRVAGMFSQRGFNIETLNVAPTDDETMSRLTLVTNGTHDVLNQINRQLLKLVDVIDVLDMTGGDHMERELMFIKLRADESEDLAKLLARLGIKANIQARIKANLQEIDRREGILTLQFLGTSIEVADLVEELTKSEHLYEVMRSGALAVTPGTKGLRYIQSEQSETPS